MKYGKMGVELQKIRTTMWLKSPAMTSLCLLAIAGIERVFYFFIRDTSVLSPLRYINMIVMLEWSKRMQSHGMAVVISMAVGVAAAGFLQILFFLL